MDVVNDSLQREEETNPGRCRDTSSPLPKQTAKTCSQNIKLKEAVREDEEEVDDDYLFKFLDHYVCKPMKKEFEDII